MCINKNAELLPYYQKAKELLNYDPETGVFTWRKTVNSRALKDSVAGSEKGKGYKRIGFNKKSLLSHRLAWFFVYNELPNSVDHIDGDTSNNSIKNLRACTNQENLLNKKIISTNKSGYRGVHFKSRSKKFIAVISYKGKKMQLGSFGCPKEASKAYEKKAKELHGEFYKDQNQ